jgi:hypothetical protein
MVNTIFILPIILKLKYILYKICTIIIVTKNLIVILYCYADEIKLFCKILNIYRLNI